MRMTRSSLLEVLRQDLLAVRAKGAPGKRNYNEACLQNAHTHSNASRYADGNIDGGTVVIEQIFSIPGLGQYLLTAYFRGIIL